MQYNSEKEIWYPEEKIFENPLTINNYEQFLSQGIRKRVSYIHTDLDLSFEQLYSDKPFLIKKILDGEYSYSSFITNKILKSIIDNANDNLENNKGNNLPEKISRFWIIFGDEQDIREFLKQLYYKICLNILSDTQNEYREQTNIILDLFYADASFSFVYGQAKINNQDINKRPNTKERRALVSAVKYTWSIISDEVLENFRDIFDDENNPIYKIKNSKDIPKRLDEWCNEKLMPYLIDKKEKLKKDSIANIGYCVHNLMETLYDKKTIDKNYLLNESQEYLKVMCDECNSYLLDCAKKLEESQRTYFANLRNSELEKTIIDNIDNSTDYQIEDTFLDDSGKTFEELINNAIKKLVKDK